MATTTSMPGSINPYQLFLVFNELVDAGAQQGGGLRSGPHARPVAQRHRPDREPDALGGEVRRAYAQALLVDRDALAGYQDGNDALMASADAEAALPHRRRADPRAWRGCESGGAIDSGRGLPRQRLPARRWRRERPAVASGGGGIV